MPRILFALIIAAFGPDTSSFRGCGLSTNPGLGGSSMSFFDMAAVFGPSLSKDRVAFPYDRAPRFLFRDNDRN